MSTNRLSVRIMKIGPFDDITLEFPDSRFVALVGPNGTGKTTVLEALAGHALVTRPRRSSPKARVWLAMRMQDRMHGNPMESEINFSAGMPSETYRTWFDERWPLVRYYPVTRGFRPIQVKGPIKTKALESDPETPAQYLKQWIINQYFFRNEPWGEKHGKQLQTLTDGLSRLFGSLHKPGLTFAGVTPELEVLFDAGTGPTPLEQLASGAQSLISIIADLIMHLTEQYPDLENPLEGRAMAIVDELELHLHPTWQQTVAAALQSLFPSTTFIVSTHSPLIVNDCEPGSLLLFRVVDGKVKVETGDQSMKGWVAEEIYRRVFDMPSTRNPGVHRLLEEYRQSFRTYMRTDSPEAAAALERLEEQVRPLLGPNDPALHLFRHEEVREALREGMPDEQEKS